jgi:hypothetical protein
MSKTEHLLTAALTPRGVMVAAAAIKPGITSLSAFPPESEAKARHANDNDQTSEHGILPVLTTCLLTGAPLVDSPAPAGFDRTRLGSPLVRRLGEPTFVEATGSTPPFAGYSGGGVAAIARCYRVVAP